MNVTKSTRASKNGKLIICPQCNNYARVYHFSWSALSCIHCDADVNKNDWILHDESINDMSYYDSLLTSGTSWQSGTVLVVLSLEFAII